MTRGSLDTARILDKRSAESARTALAGRRGNVVPIEHRRMPEHRVIGTARVCGWLVELSTK